MNATYLWETRFIAVFIPVRVNTPSGLLSEAREKHDELAKALHDFVVHEPEVEPTRQGLRLNFTFRFEPDFLRFDSAQRQNELIIDPRKILLEQRLKDSGAKPSRSR